MIEVIRFKYTDRPLFNICNSIRAKVFIIEQKVTPELEYEFEEDGNYYLLFDDKNPVATARYRETSEGIKLERFAVLMEYRNKGIGSKLLDEVLKDVIPIGKKIYLHSQIKAVPYYERAGFVKKGDIFLEADIEHYLMEFKT